MIPKRRWSSQIYSKLQEVICTQKPGLASFDFDQTLIQQDLAVDVIEYLIEKHPPSKKITELAHEEIQIFLTTRKSPSNLPSIISQDLLQNKFDSGKYFALLHQIDINFAYTWSRFLFAGIHQDELENIGMKVFCQGLYEKKTLHISREMQEIVQILHEKKWKVIIVSASPKPILTTVAEMNFGIYKDNLFAMDLAIDKQGYTLPKIIQPMTSFDGKVSVLKKHFACRPSIAFGDSVSDIPMLKYAKLGILLNQTNQLVQQIADYPHIYSQQPFA